MGSLVVCEKEGADMVGVEGEIGGRSDWIRER